MHTHWVSLRVSNTVSLGLPLGTITLYFTGMTLGLSLEYNSVLSWHIQGTNVTAWYICILLQHVLTFGVDEVTLYWLFGRKTGMGSGFDSSS